MPKFIALTTGEYSYQKRVEYKTEQFTGHSVYGLDKEGQIWKFVCQDNNWKWAKLEECKPESYD